MKSLKFLLITFLLVSCAVKVNYDYEKATDFNTYKSYNYFDDMTTGLSELDNKRLIRVMDAKLETMGLTRSENPDFFIDIKSQNIQGRNNSNVGVGVGGGGGRLGGGLSVGIPIGQNKATREISIEFVDDTKTGMFWQAITESSYTDNDIPEKREEQFKVIVEKVFSSYPPKQNE
ncbi:DUF4136 domain-containing protein [Winogradskyella undariae]|uniref:DUF4136 domain-containing protein n=1 Tax=Winogradskyella TaxID=286104 RepID=UPI00156B8170|nr:MULTISPECIES: DUF4136 domain-containing protein [Winogradskyella]NRR91634.1 DUF4136 domain-containing protein [Winogradskyella undariae]QXP77848.1 DUF4136 domain-containing protein [Winogradskyella sp. HaHa_3_26]